MSKSRKIRQRANRKEKRQLKHALTMQAENNSNETPIGKYMDLNQSFKDFAISETKREIKNGLLDLKTTELLEKVIKINKKLKPN